jgi:NAD(P)H-flavin reductase
MTDFAIHHKQNQFLPRLFRVRAAWPENDDTMSLELAPGPSGEAAQHGEAAHHSEDAPYGQPGQFNMLYAFGIGEIPVSVSAFPEPRHGLIHTIRGVGAVSQALCRMTTGETLGLRGPFGRGWPLDDFAGHDLLIVAGGLGLAALRPVMRWAMANDAWFSRVTLVYGARSPRQLIFSEDLEIWRQNPAIEVMVTADTAESGWQGSVGSVMDLVNKIDLHPQRTVAFVCGPEIMMRFAATALLGKGLPGERLFFSLERNMKCAIGICGHCMFGPTFVCKDGPILPYSAIAHLFFRSEI